MLLLRFIKKAGKYAKHYFTLRRYHVLEELIKNNKFTSFAEIGVWDGDTTRHLLGHCKTLKRVVCVDDYKDNNGGYVDSRVRHAFNNVQDLKVHPKVEFLFKDSYEASLEIEDNSLDLIFIDANHTYDSVKEDIYLWYPKLKDGGIISGHDFQIKFIGVINAVTEIFFPIKVKEDNVWYAKKDNLIL